ncbi:MAG: 2-thiouracil desulfurase family protein [Bacillota bacterium]|jgi:tRNA 2-thiocytidine biosynthesis protein TtcA
MSATAKKMMKYFRRAVIDYSMIADERSIMVGLSGGKDSLALLYLLSRFLPNSKYKYRLAAGHIGLGFETENDLNKLRQFCQNLGVEFFYEPTDISKVVFEIREETNPCSLCAKMRRGALNSLAKKHGFDKVALGHHLDDVVETLMLNMCFEGRVDSFKPVTYLSNQQVTVIRPMIYIQEQTVRTFAKQENLPIVPSCCPANGKTKREDMKDTISAISEFCPQARYRMLRALQNVQGNEWCTDKKPKVNTNPAKTKPILVSRCLVGEPCRYNGETKADERVTKFLQNKTEGMDYILVCPEVSGGLPIPRSPGEIENGDTEGVFAGTAKVIGKNGEDYTAEFLKGAEKVLKIAEENGARIALLKERSPSCGSHQIYDGTFSGKELNGMGVCAYLLKKRKMRIYSEGNFNDFLKYMNK